MSIWPDPGIVSPSLQLLALSRFSGVCMLLVFSDDILEVKDDIQLIERLRVVQAIRVDRLAKFFPQEIQDGEADSIRLSFML